MQDDIASRVELSVPADGRYVRPARLLASGVGMSSGLPLEDVEDFRIAVDELCAALADLGRHVVRLVLELAGEALVVVGTTQTPPSAPIDDHRANLSRQILAVVADGHLMERSGDTVTFTVRKRLQGSDIM